MISISICFIITSLDFAELHISRWEFRWEQVGTDMSSFEFKTTVFRRPTRNKKTKRLDEKGNPKEIAVKGGWVYRIRYVDPEGQPRSQERGPFPMKNRAKDACDQAVRALEKSAGQIRVGERMTFNQLADRCKTEFYRPAILRDGKKISGVRSINAVLSQIDHLKKFFGKRQINSITLESLTRYKEHRTSQPIGSARTAEAMKKKVAIATVNRELAVMRKMMRYAYREGWLLRDVFYNAKVIETSSEKARSVTLSYLDEQRLLSCLEGEREIEYVRKRNGKVEKVKARIAAASPLLKPMIILAIDSGLRRGEILKLRWKDIDFETECIHIVGTHTKTEQERLVPLSARVKNELLKLRIDSADERPFPIRETKTSFKSVARLAGLPDLRFHDLRRTFVTRQLGNGISTTFVAKVAGHAQIQTTMKHYTGVGIAEIRQINEQINSLNDRVAEIQVHHQTDSVN